MTSFLVTTCHQLRKKPIDEFTVEDLRIMIGQGIGLAFLMPLALDVLEHDALAEGDFFPGDLLCNVLRTGSHYWDGHEGQHERVQRIISSIETVPEEVVPDLTAWNERGQDES